MQSVHFGWSIKFSLFIRFTSAALYTQMFFNEVNVIDGYEQMETEIEWGTERLKSIQHNKRSITAAAAAIELADERATKREKLFDRNGFKQMNLKSTIFAKRLISCLFRCACIFSKLNMYAECRLADRRTSVHQSRTKKDEHTIFDGHFSHWKNLWQNQLLFWCAHSFRMDNQITLRRWIRTNPNAKIYSTFRMANDFVFLCDLTSLAFAFRIDGRDRVFHSIHIPFFAICMKLLTLIWIFEANTNNYNNNNSNLSWYFPIRLNSEICGNYKLQLITNIMNKQFKITSL